MFASLFKRAEQSVDSAIGDLGNRIIITIPFLVAMGFGAASLTLYLDRLYGSELGTLLVAIAFCLLGLIIAIVVRVRRNLSASNSNAKDDAASPEENLTSRPQSMFDDETVMAVMSSAAPIVIPAMIRTGLKNWPVLLAAAAGLYVASRSNHQSAATPNASPPSPSS